MVSIFKKSNYIELKTLEYYFNGDTKKAENVYKIRHCLKAEWFELFIKFYLEELKYKMNKWIWWLKADGWIDLKWTIDNQKIYIQCKKYFKNHLFKWNINVWQIRNFFWWVVSEDHKYKNSIKIFASTLDYTSVAKGFANKNNIELWDYTDIASICEVYNFEDFEKALIGRWIRTEKYISSYQYGIAPIKEFELDEDDIYLFLSNIREKLAIKNNKDSNVWFIYKNETLRIFAKNRPYNYQWLKKVEKFIDTPNEVSHLYKYWKEVIKWLNMLI